MTWRETVLLVLLLAVLSGLLLMQEWERTKAGLASELSQALGQMSQRISQLEARSGIAPPQRPPTPTSAETP